MFEFLFKYPAADFAAGAFVSILSPWQWALLPLGLAALAFVALGYFRQRGQTRRGDRVAIALMRGLVLAAIVFSLSSPLLEVTSRLPQPGIVGLLFDDSISMGLANADGATRADFIRQQFDPNGGALLQDLRHRFDLRLFKFGAEARAIAAIDALEFDDGASDLPRALEFARETLRGQPLAGLVVISDGALRTSAALDKELLSLRSASIPVFSLGLGETDYPRDVEISQVRLPRAILNGSRVMAEVLIRQRGYDGQTVELLVEDDSRILHKQQLVLKPGVQSLRIPLATEDAGARRLDFRLAALDGESIAANNSRSAILGVDDRRKRILYFEGEPRFEMKFVRRAVADDDNLGVTGLIRTADAKFYRVGIENRDELRNGFPITREELFAYDAIVLGSVDISLLSREQQQMIVEFVGQRGGGLLMLGGRHSFSEGGYRDSLLHEISPVVMADEAQPDFHRSIKIQPTDAAWVHPALLIADSGEKSVARWQTLPPLDIVNPIRRVKPGATLLLQSPGGENNDPWVAMAWQRYGRGKVIAFPVQNSWLWQMHHEIDLEDQTHELLWRQLLRWLVEDVPRRLELTLSTQTLHAGGTLRLRAEALGADYTSAREAQPLAVLTAPDGVETTLSLAPHPALPGTFEASLPLARPGDYRARLELDESGDMLRSAETRVQVNPDGDEYFGSEMNLSLLRRIGEESSGGFFAANEVGRLVDALDDNQRGSRALVRHQLWDMPILFLLLVTLLCAEWAYRRWRGLP